MGIEKQSSYSNKNNSNSIFICYAREDLEYAEKLYKDLKNCGLNPWLNKEKLLPGQHWIPEIEKAIKNSMYFIPLFSKYSIENKGYMQKEVRFAIETAEEMPEGQIYIIPIRIDECQIPFDKLSKIHYQDMFPYWDIGLERIFQTTRIMEKWKKYKEILITKIQRANEVLDKSKRYMQDVKEEMNIIFDNTVPSMVAHIDLYRDGYENIIKKGAKIRLITDVTNNNINFCKEIKEWVTELRFLKEIEFGFAVGNNQYMGAFSYQKASDSDSEYHLMKDVLVSDKVEFTKHMQHIFNTFWTNAYSSEERFKEIEDELKRDIERADKNLNNNPNDTNALNHKALALNRLGKYENALEYIDNALDLNTKSSEIFDTKGEILLNLKRYTEASEYFTKSLNNDPNNMDARNHMTLVSLIGILKNK